MKKSTKLYFTLAFYLSANIAFAQNAKVIDTPSGTVISNAGGTDIPHSASILDIRSTNKGVLFPRMTTPNRDAITVPQAGLLLYNTSTNQFNYHNGSSWQEASFGNQWGVNGSILHHSGPVGVGASAMLNANTFFMVRGNLGGTNLEGMYVDASSGSGKPFYGYSRGTSPRAYHYYDANRWALALDGTDRITVTSSGYVGIGMNLSAPQYPLHVNGTTYLNGYTYINNTAEINSDLLVNGIFDVDTDGNINRDATVGRNLSVAGTSNLTGNVSMGNNATIDGTLTVNNNKGVAYNASSSTNLRIYRFNSGNFTVNLGPHASTTGAIVFLGGFTSTPHVIVGDIESSSGSAGELHRVILVLSGCALNTSTGETGCNAKLINTDNVAVNYEISWNCIAIGY